jgi:hypothetical protein
LLLWLLLLLLLPLLLLLQCKLAPTIRVTWLFSHCTPSATDIERSSHCIPITVNNDPLHKRYQQKGNAV